jgi:hypothetical protein
MQDPPGLEVRDGLFDFPADAVDGSVELPSPNRVGRGLLAF